MSLTANLPPGLLPDLPLGPPTALGLFQYGLPVLLGYTLYVGIAGRFGPGRPAAAIERPGWFLGVWTALSVATIVATAMHFAYGRPLDEARELFVSATALLGAALLPGYVLWFLWSRAARRAHAGAEPPPAATVDADGLAPFGPAREPTADDVLPFDLDLELDLDPQRGVDPARAFGPTESPEPRPGARATPPVETDDAGPPALEAAELEATVGAEAAPAGPAAVDGPTDDAPAIADGDGYGDVLYVPIAVDEDARRALEQERVLREETERHLQVTRRALYSLDAAAREGENERADALIALETELESHVRRSSAAEARATHEECERVRAETDASRLKTEVLRVRSELRRSAEARARAVATAGKSVAFARRTLRARAALEERLREAEESLANRQETISSLIRALESEKGRTREMVSSRAKQLVLHERQLRERRSLEEVARSVEGKLSTRLVKKVARARPLASG